jgi:cytochrome c peroxidase
VNVRTGVVGVAIIGLVVGCSSSSEDDPTKLTAEEQASAAKLTPLPDVPADPTNKYADNAMAAALGQKLFFEKRFSGELIEPPDDGMTGALGKVRMGNTPGDTNKIACVSCHDPQHWFIDTRSKPPTTSLGVGYDIRNSPTLVNAQFYKWTENDGVVDMEWADGLFAVELPWVMGGSRLQVAHTIYDHYKTDYEAVFGPLDPGLDPMAMDAARFPATGLPKPPPGADGKPVPDGPWEMMKPEDQDAVNRIFANMGKATGAYMRKLVSRNAPFDKYEAGDKTQMTEAAQRGLKLFVGKANCVGCHKNTDFNDDDFHNTGYTPDPKQVHIDINKGLPLIGVPPGIELGRFASVQILLNVDVPFNSDGKYSDDTMTHKLDGLVQADGTSKPDDLGKWRTKGLRLIKETAPYFHNGQFATLLDVVKFYNDGGGQTMSDGGTPGYVGTKDDKMKKLNLSDGEMSDIVEFLNTLTGDPVPHELLMDTSAP